ncbi:hypothetical protein QNO07_23190 [Streptomyces sp. 549]|uniref:hypothetical protein n=1 Tax=Streptomyces sp. 549 TaxID=3049076 RepID=UPI0024C3F74A|nr:hypothetical protein [Streptomyces sp. 549]MDK1476289.1 hypothetical protein [Streptomyces sp. 549]
MSTSEYQPRTPVSPGAWDTVPSAYSTYLAPSAVLAEPSAPGPAAAPPERPPRRPAPPPAAPARQAAPPAPAPDGRAAVPAPADPVRTLMHRHRRLCERAVDPLEIAAGLEAHGVTDRTAARFRHRDVFSLAEELFARVPRSEGGGAPRPLPRAAAPAPAQAALWLLPGGLCAVTVAVLPAAARLAPGAGTGVAAAAVGLVGAAGVLAALRLCLRGVRLGWLCVLWCGWLLAYALFGDWLLAGLLAGGPSLPPAPAGAGVPLTLAFAVAPAAWCAHWFASRSRRRLAVSRTLGEFTGRTRPLLAAAALMFTLALLALQSAARFLLPPDPAAGSAHAATAAVTALAVLLFTALLLAAHGYPRVAAAGLAAACGWQAAALGAALAVRLLPPLQDPAADLVRAVDRFGPALVPAAGCALAAAVLLAYAATALTGAWAHRPEPR